MGYKQRSTIAIIEGGTNADDFVNTNGTVYYDGTRLVTVFPGTVGQVLTSGGASAPSFQNFSAGAIQILDGDTGSATGTTVTIAGGSNMTTSATAATLTVDLDDTVSISGSMTAGTGLIATTGGITATGNSTINGTGVGTTTIGNASGGAISIASGAASDITMANQSLTVNTGIGALNLSNDATANSVNIATGAGAKSVVIGSTNTTSAVTINSGTGAINIGTSIAKAINVGNNLNNTFVTITSRRSNIQLNDGFTSITFNGDGNGFVFGLAGNNNIFDVRSGTAGISLGVTSTSGVINLGNASSGTMTLLSSSSINISNNTTANSVNVATGAGAKALTLGSTNTTSSVTVNTGSGGITIPSFTTTGAVVSTAAGLLSDADASTAGFVLTSNGAGSAPSFQAVGGGISSVDQTSSPVTMAVNSHYSMNLGSLITATLPATAAFGSVIKVSGYGTGLWTIAQNSGQTIHFGSVDTTTGVGGSLSSTERYDSIELFCAVADTDFVVVNCIGNLTYV